jgi:hypothetical protein
LQPPKHRENLGFGWLLAVFPPSFLGRRTGYLSSLAAGPKAVASAWRWRRVVVNTKAPPALRVWNALGESLARARFVAGGAEDPRPQLERLPERLVRQLPALIGECGLSEMSYTRAAAVVRSLAQVAPNHKRLMLRELREQLQRWVAGAALSVFLGREGGAGSRMRVAATHRAACRTPSSGSCAVMRV